MPPSSWASIVAIVGVIGLGVTLACHMAHISYRMGQRDARIAALEAREPGNCAEQLASLGATMASLAATVGALKETTTERMQSLEHTVRNMLMARSAAARRPPPGGGQG